MEALTVPKSQELIVAPYKNRINGLKHPVPNVCLKVPTGGGKTLLGASGVERINTDFFERNNGLVLWVVPSDSIYKQTLKALTDRESLYRQTLDRASGSKVKILQKTDSFHPSDVENFLCVMLLMLQSAGRQTKETLRIFKDSGKFPYFFPEVDDYHSNQKLIETCPNLDTYKISNTNKKDDTDFAGDLEKTTLKHSLGNVLKLVQPLIVIDEGHRAYTETAKTALMDFNPRFILELSATPNKKSHESNILVSVTGGELKKEEMIKLPINIYNLENKDWKNTLAKGHEILQKLSNHARKAQIKESRYIRPIQLIRVERTGKDQREKKFIHSEDVREINVRRRKPFRGLKIFLPKVLYKKGKNLKELSYEEDLLFNIDWSKLKLNQTPILNKQTHDISHTQVDIKKQMELISSFQSSKEEEAPENFNMDFGFMCQRLSDIIPNLWNASETVDKALSSLKRKYGKEIVYLNRFHILDFLRNNLQEQISKKTETLFREKLKSHEIIFKLVSAGDPDLNWQMAETLSLSVSEKSDFLRKRNNKDLGIRRRSVQKI